jgi:hypothetical protein
MGNCTEGPQERLEQESMECSLNEVERKEIMIPVNVIWEAIKQLFTKEEEK